MGDGLKFFSAKLHFVKNHDIVRRFCRALEGSVCLEEEVDYRRVSIPFQCRILIALQRPSQDHSTNERHVQLPQHVRGSGRCTEQ